jgi:hypothetical protein
MRIALVVPMLAASLAAGALPAAAATHTLVISSCTKATYKPRSYVIACADAGQSIEHATYRDWTRTVAHGAGTWVVNICKPDCAAGHDRHYRITFTLSRPVTDAGRRVFSRITIKRAGHHAHRYDLVTKPLG